MAENWTCSGCQAFNPPRRKICWECGRSRSEPAGRTFPVEPERVRQREPLGTVPEPLRDAVPERVRPREGVPEAAGRVRQPEPVLAVPKKGRRIKAWWVLAALAFLALVVGLWGYQADRSDFRKLEEAYRQADCAEVLERGFRLDRRWRLVDLGGYPDQAAEYQEDCLPFQAAVEQEEAGELVEALAAYNTLVVRQGQSSLVEAARRRARALFEGSDLTTLAGLGSCGQVDALVANGLVPEPDRVLPPFYLACARYFEAGERLGDAVEMHLALLQAYPGHELAAEAKAAVLANPASCDRYSLVKELFSTDPAGPMPTFLWDCGQRYEIRGDLARAAEVYGQLWEHYPEHSLAPEAEAALARALVELAKAAGAGEMAPPERSGGSGGEAAVILIQNDSPQRLRIVFSGPEQRVTSLEPCDSCQNYSVVGPMFCPEKGPVGRYELVPGAYDVVVESISDSEVIPFAGRWELEGGGEYSQCFFVVLTLDF